MNLFRYSILVGCVVSFWCSGAELLQAQPTSAYQQGMEQLYRGDVNEALAFWETNYEEQSRLDARIGFEYMRVVTERDLAERFESATDMYYRALLNGTGANSRIAVRQEIERLQPIVGIGSGQTGGTKKKRNSGRISGDIGYGSTLLRPAQSMND